MKGYLDLAIKNACLKYEGYSDTGVGYLAKNGKIYTAYMDNVSYDSFVKEMKEYYPQAFSAFGAIELSERKTPPHMASYANSARMLYLLARDNELFEFEKELPTKIGGTAKLDGYVKGKNIFVEAKCHEPYDKEKEKVGDVYSNLYEYISKKTSLKIDFNGGIPTFTYDGLEIAHFDIKQMICHMLGIANGVLSGAIDNKPIKFLYLLYNPEKLDIGEYKSDILRTYNSTVREANMDFEHLYRAVFEFLSKGKECSENMFSFELCSQENFKEKINGN